MAKVRFGHDGANDQALERQLIHIFHQLTKIGAYIVDKWLVAIITTINTPVYLENTLNILKIYLLLIKIHLPTHYQLELEAILSKNTHQLFHGLASSVCTFQKYNRIHYSLNIECW